MRFFGKAKRKSERVLVFDVRSSSVSGTFFERDGLGVAKMLASFSESIVFEKQLKIDRFFFFALKSLDVIVNKIASGGLGAPDRVFCVLSSPLHVSQTRVISMKKNTNFVFNTKLADDLIQKEIYFLEKEYFKESEHADGKLRLIELKNISIKLNGYEIAEPLNKNAKELEMTLFISMSGDNMCKKIELTIAKHFTVKQVKFLSATMTSFAVVRDIFAEHENFLLVNIGGEVTDISMVKGNILRESISFPLGTNFMVRGVASSMDSTLNEAKSFFSLFKDGHASVPITKSLSPVLDQLKSTWLGRFQESLANISNDISIPALLYIIIDKDLTDFFSELIKAEQFNQYTLTESKFQLVFLDVKVLRDFVSLGRDVEFDSFLAIDTIYIDRFLK